MSREKIFEQLWSNNTPAQPKRAFNSELWRLRKTLASAGLDGQKLVVSDAETVAFKTDLNVDIDLYLFDQAAAKAINGSDNAQTTTREIERLYQGELLAGIYDDWCLTFRETYRGYFLEAMENLLTAQINNRCWRDAIRIGRRIVKEDPLLEHVHREIMRSYAHLGERAAAIRQYEDLCARLDKELGVAPSSESAALRDAIISDEKPDFSQLKLRSKTLDELKTHISDISAALRDAENALERLSDSLSQTAE